MPIDTISPLFIDGNEARILGEAVMGEIESLDDFHWMTQSEKVNLKEKLQELFLRLAAIEGSGLYGAPFCEICEGQYEDVLDGLCGECRGEDNEES